MIKIRMYLKKKWKTAVPAFLIAFSLLLNLAGWISRSFCNFYARHIFPVWVETYGRLTGLFPFSVGERMLYLAAVLTAVLALWSSAAFVRAAIRRCRIGPGGKKPPENKRLPVALGIYGTVYFWITGVVCLVMTLNCFLLYHVSPVYERYEIGGAGRERYGAAEIAALRDYVVEQANALAPLMSRDGEGDLVYEGDMIREAKEQMGRLSGRIDTLKGYYPDPKPLWASDFFSQQYIMGYYFPFSMEANYNDIMYVVNLPTTLCHELSHLKGFILEDEANFIGYLACVDSEDDFFGYSAYLSVLGYLDRDFYQAAGKDREVYQSHPAISELVLRDDIFLTGETWEEVEETALISTETVKEVSNTFTETALVLNGVEDGRVSYSRVVDLLLRYYDGILY